MKNLNKDITLKESGYLKKYKANKEYFISRSFSIKILSIYTHMIFHDIFYQNLTIIENFFHFKFLFKELYL